LRKFGLGGNYDLRRELSPQQKAAITRQADRYGSIINYPDNFAIVQVKNKTAESITAAAKKVKQKGGKTKLIVPIEKGQKVSIKRGHLAIKDKQFSEEIYPGGWKFFENAQKVFKKKLKSGEYVTIRVGGNRPFSRIFKSMGELLNYAQGWMPNDWNRLGNGKKAMAERQELKNSLIDHISITRINFKKK